MQLNNEATTKNPPNIYYTATACFFLLIALGACRQQPAGPDTRPNVIFILADDHRYDIMEFTEKVPKFKTPSMDRIARERAHLQNAYVSTALCSPSRASIL